MSLILNDTNGIQPVFAGRIDKSGPGPRCVNIRLIPGPSRTRKGFDLMEDATPTSLYRYYDGKGILLYVGITSRGMTRNSEHNKTQPWWPYVASQDVQHFDDRPLAMKAERSLIRKHRPPFNKQHNPDKGMLAESYIKLRTMETPGRSPGVVMSENDGRLRMEIVQRDGKFMQCRSVPEDLELAVRINFALSDFTSYALPDHALVGHVISWGRDNYAAEMNLKASWLNRVDGVNAIVDSKTRGHLIRTIEFRIDGAWVTAVPQRLSNPNFAVNSRRFNQIGRL